ncbi:hypothetical protein F2Q69_00054757 [Brassica cretica]|uniref:Uncharacterized protein n=1 Tax=Brassica cretica TaxID=69181 RepID=A0A8S9NDE3_BRACR|nr:hypothetical protein F2Q69_00054757 [Brassica cretica]
MWFPIPGTIVCALHHFGLSISQLSVPALQHWLGVLISSYELGMDLNPGDFGWGVCRGELPPPILSGVELQPWILPPTPADLFAKRDLLRGRPFFWNSFTVERIRSAVKLHRSRAVSQPLDVPYDVEPVIDVLPAQRQSTRSGTSEVPPPSDFFADLPPDFTTQESLDEESRRKVVAEGSSLINEVEEQSRRQAELHSRALVREERRGKRAIVAEMKQRAALFATEFDSFKDAHEFVGDFRECRGSVAILYQSQNEDFSFPAEVAEMSGLMNGCAHAESLVPPIEGRVRQLWDSIEVSEDTAEAGTGVGDEGAGVADGEVDQPASSFGVSMSGFFDFEL